VTTTDVEDSATAETFCGPALGAEYNKLHMILTSLLKNFKNTCFKELQCQVGREWSNSYSFSSKSNRIGEIRVKRVQSCIFGWGCYIVLILIFVLIHHYVIVNYLSILIFKRWWQPGKSNRSRVVRLN